MKDSSLMIQARTMTPDQQRSMWGIVLDPNGGVAPTPAPVSTGLPKVMPEPFTGQAPKVFLDAISGTPSTEKNVYASGNTQAIQNYTNTNIAPASGLGMTTANLAQAKEAVPPYAGTIGQQVQYSQKNFETPISQPYTPPAQPAPQSTNTLYNPNVPAYAGNVAQQVQYSQAVGANPELPPTFSSPSNYGVTAPPSFSDFVKALPASAPTNAGLTPDEKAAYLSSVPPYASNVNDQTQYSQKTFTTPEIGTQATPDMFYKATGSVTDGFPIIPPNPFTTGNVQQAQPIIAPQVEPIVSKPTTATTEPIKVETPTIKDFVNASQNTPPTYNPQENKQVAVTPMQTSTPAPIAPPTPAQPAPTQTEIAKKLGLTDGVVNPTDGTVWDAVTSNWVTPEQKRQMDQVASGNLPIPMIPKGEVPSAITTQPQATVPEQTNLQKATAEVERQIAEQNKALDLQMKQAEGARDLSLQSQKDAYAKALRDMRDQAFGQQRQAMQQYAGRGLLSSGIFQDAMIRLGMSISQNVRDMDIKRQAEIGQTMTNFNDALDKINLKREELQSGKAKNVQDLTKQMNDADAEAQKAINDAKKLEKDSQDTMFKVASDMLQTLASQGQVNIMPYIPYLISGNLNGLAQQMYNTKDNPALSVAGQQTLMKMAESQQTINSMETDITRNKALAAETWSKIKGVITDEKGNPILKNGKTQPTQSATEFQKELGIKQQEATTAAKNAATSASKTKGTTIQSKAQQDQTIKNVIDPLIKDVYYIPVYDENGKQTGTKSSYTPDPDNPTQKPTTRWLPKDDEAKFEQKMQELYNNNMIDADTVKEKYMALNKRVPGWLGAVSDNDILNFGK